MERTGVVCEAYDLLEAHDEFERLEDRGEQIGRPIPGARPCWRRTRGGCRALSLCLSVRGSRKCKQINANHKTNLPSFGGRRLKARWVKNRRDRRPLRIPSI
jgi:hypothetical protein